MFVPTLPQSPVLDKETGYWTAEYQLFWQTLVQNMQQSVSNEGFIIPSQVQGDVNVIEPTALNGTLLFNASEINGGSSDQPNGQLYVKLADGTFHAVTNT